MLLFIKVSRYFAATQLATIKIMSNQGWWSYLRPWELVTEEQYDKTTKKQLVLNKQFYRKMRQALVKSLDLKETKTS